MGLEKQFHSLIFIVCLLFFSSFLLAFLGFFYPLLILLLSGLLFILFSHLFKKQALGRKKFFKTVLTKGEFIVLLFISLTCLYTSIFFNPSLLEGRDAGAMTEAAVMLSKKHQLEFQPPSLSIFNNQDSNQLALNYPGFVITPDHQLKTQFNIGYISYLAFWYALLQEKGLKIANLFGLALGLFAIFYIVKYISKNSVLALASLPLIFFSFPFFWHTRQNFSETLAFGFLFSAIYCLVKISRSTKISPFLTFLTLLSLFCFTTIRIEGLFISLPSIALLYLFYRQKKSASKPFPLKKIILFTLLLAALFFFYSLSITPFYKKVVKDLLDWQPQNSSSSQIFSFKEKIQQIFYISSIFYYYGLAALAFLGLLRIAFAFSSFLQSLLQALKKNPFKKTTLSELFKKISPAAIPLIIAGPFLIYLLKPTISLDHPWLLRRFMFAVIPLFVIYTVLFIYEITQKKQSGFIILALLIAFPLCIFIDYGFIKTNPQLTRQIEVLSENFKKNDLILVDKSSAFDNWSLISAPLRFLFNKSAVYIYNPADIAKISQTSFKERTYLIATEKNAGDYQKYIDPEALKQNFTLSFRQLNVTPFNKKEYPTTILLPLLTSEEKTVYIYKLKPEAL